MARLGLLLVFIGQLCFTSNYQYTEDSEHSEIIFKSYLYDSNNNAKIHNFEILVPLTLNKNFKYYIKNLFYMKWEYLARVDRYLAKEEIPHGSVLYDIELVDKDTYILGITENRDGSYNFIIAQGNHDNMKTFSEFDDVIAVFCKKLQEEQEKGSFGKTANCNCCSIQ